MFNCKIEIVIINCCCCGKFILIFSCSLIGVDVLCEELGGICGDCIMLEE